MKKNLPFYLFVLTGLCILLILSVALVNPSNLGAVSPLGLLSPLIIVVAIIHKIYNWKEQDIYTYLVVVLNTILIFVTVHLFVESLSNIMGMG